MGDATTATNIAMGVSGASAGVTTAASLADFINEYAVLIGLALTVISLLVGIYFNIQTIKWRRQQDDARIAAAVAEALQGIEQQQTCKNYNDNSQNYSPDPKALRRPGNTNRT